MKKIVDTHIALEKLNINKLQKAKRLKAPPTEKQFNKDYPQINLKVDDDFSNYSIKDILKKRKSIRDYSKSSVSFSQLSNILFYSYGIKEYRNNVYNIKKYPVSYSPSAGGLQPFNVYVFVSNVENLKPGLYYYSPLKNALLQLYTGMPQLDLANFYLTDFPMYAAINIVIVGDIKRFNWKYGYRGYRLLNVDCGILSQDISLLTVSQNLGSCMIAAFSNDKVQEVLQLSENELPLLCISIGAYHE